MRARGGYFEQLLWQYSAIWQETFLFLSNVTRFLDCFFFKLPQSTSNFRKVVWQYTEIMVEMLYRFCSKFTWLFSSEIILKIRWELTKLSPWVWCTTFLLHSVDTVDVLCAQLTRFLFEIAKFLLVRPMVFAAGMPTVQVWTCTTDESKDVLHLFCVEFHPPAQNRWNITHLSVPADLSPGFVHLNVK